MGRSPSIEKDLLVIVGQIDSSCQMLLIIMHDERERERERTRLDVVADRLITFAWLGFVGNQLKKRLMTFPSIVQQRS